MTESDVKQKDRRAVAAELALLADCHAASAMAYEPHQAYSAEG